MLQGTLGILGRNGFYIKEPLLDTWYYARQATHLGASLVMRIADAIRTSAAIGGGLRIVLSMHRPE